MALASRLAPSDANAGIGVTNVLNDLGPLCTSNVAKLRETLRDVCGPNGPEEATLARLLLFFSERASGGATGWDLGVVSQTLRDDYGSSRDWGLVAQKLDFEDFHIRSADHLKALLKLYEVASNGKVPPLASFVGEWQNQTGQLSLLEWLLLVPSEVYTFQLTDDEAADASIIPPTGATVQCPNPGGWACAAVLQRLLFLSDQPSLNKRVRDLFVRVLLGCPEVLLCSLVRLQLNVSKEGNAAKISAGKQLKGELMRELIPTFFKPNPKVPVKYGAAAISRLWAISPTTVNAACTEAWRSTSSEGEAARYNTIVHIIQHVVKQLPTADEASAMILNGNKDPEFSVAFAFIMADNNLLQLQKFLKDRTPSSGGGATALFLVGLIAYLGKGYQAARPRVRAGQPMQPPLISLENLSESLQFLRSLDDAILKQDIPSPSGGGGGESSGIKIGDSSKALIDACLNAHPSLKSSSPNLGPATGGPVIKGSAEDIEEMANKYFQKIYTSEQGLNEVVEMLKKFKASGNTRENDIFACMIHNLFDEYRFFPKYPEKELRITGILFGKLIQEQLVSSITLGIALRYVLEALRKEPKGGDQSPQGKMFRFGMFALEQFKERLHEWPQYCSHIVQIPHLKQNYEALVGEIEGAMKQHGQMGTDTLNSASADADVQQKIEPQRPLAVQAVPAVVPVVMPKIEPAIFGVGLGRSFQDKEEVQHDAPPGLTLDKVQFLINNLSMSNVEQKAKDVKNMLDPKYFGWLGSFLVVKRISTQPNFHTLYLAFLDNLGVWGKGLVEAILSSVYYNIGVCLRSGKITTSTTERSLLKNLGSWLGQTTLARNRPIMQVMLDCKELLFQGYETGRLIAVTPFVAKILEGAKNSIIFRPPNPWVMGLMRVFRALYDVEDLKMNIKFEIEVLCKNLGLNLSDITLRNNELARRAPPVKERNPDFNIKASSSASARAAPSATVATGAGLGVATLEGKKTGLASATMAATTGIGLSSAFASAATGGKDGTSTGDQEATAIPNLASYLQINASLIQVLTQANSRITEDAVKRCVPLAVDKAIRETIAPAVDRSVSIACITTKEIITKDFAMEGNEDKMRSAAQLMAANLAGSMALVTCRDMLRTSISVHLRQLLSSAAAGGGDVSSLNETEQNTIAQAAAMCAADNLDIGCKLIEKAATEKAAKEVVNAIAGALSTRKKHREQTGQPFYDMSIFSNKDQRYPTALPEQLRPKPGGLRPDQLQVYEAFQRMPSQIHQVGVEGGADGAKGGQQVNVEALAIITNKLDSSVGALMTAAGPRANEIFLTMIPNEHEIKQILAHTKKMMPTVVPGSPPIFTDAESGAILGFAQGIFKKLYEISYSEPLRLEVYVALLAALGDCMPKLKTDLAQWATFAPTENDGQIKQHRSVMLLLLRERLISPADMDIYLASVIDKNEASAAWVEFAVLFVRSAVLNKIVSPSGLPKVVAVLKKIADGMYKTSDQVFQAYRKPILRLLEELQSAAPVSIPTLDSDRSMVGGASSHEASSSISSQSLNNLASASYRASEVTQIVSSKDPQGMKQQVATLLEQWILIYQEGPSREKTTQFVQLLVQNGVGKMEDQTERFFRMSTEIVVEAMRAQAQQGKPVRYQIVDAYTSLCSSMIRLMQGSPQQLPVLDIILGAMVRCLMSDYQRTVKMASAAGATIRWDQKPWFRLLLSTSVDLLTPSTDGVDLISFPILKEIGAAFHVVQPLVIPEFSFGWLELVSHRVFLANLLLLKDHKGWEIAHQLLVDLFLFLEPHLRRNELTDAVKEFYKGTLRVLVVLLHDFPEFIACYHLSFCNVIPDNCIQLRNLILSAIPTGMELPDPFTPNLKIDLLPEVAQSPPVLSNITGPLASMQADLDNFLMGGQQKKNFLSTLLPRLYKEGTNVIDTPRVNSLVLYVGMRAIKRLHNSQIAHSLAQTPEMEILQKLMELDDRGRYTSLNAIANQLRYPSSHTHYYSCVMLFLFSDAKDEGVKEQVTRVLLERLIVHRPHPWGLMITFIELIKNQRYQFWSHSFTRCSTEIEKVFESVAKSCVPQNANSSLTTQ